jgi:cellulose synthase/poly-beta-1,6-N-acetylglucosamine synthase-like glycosyltransferase
MPVERLDPSRSKLDPLSPLIERVPVRKSDQLTASATSFVAPTPMVPLTSTKSVEDRGRASPFPDSATSPVPAVQSQSRRIPNADLPGSNGATSSDQRDAMSVGEDDLAIFEQMRHQLILWLRIEAVSAGLEITGQGPAQLLEMLRQQSRIDQTRLQVVSTLLNLANQVVKTSTVSVLDYKQALMFHLMHTRRF